MESTMKSFCCNSSLSLLAALIKNFSRSFSITGNLEAQVIGHLDSEQLLFGNRGGLFTGEGSYEVVSV